MRVELIAEVSSNHGGDLSLAKAFIHAFADAGADWIKFQTTRVKHLRPDDPQYGWFQQAELSDDAHAELKAECDRVGVKFLTTVFHPAEIPMLKALGLEAIKIGSGEAGDNAFERAVKAAGFPRVIISDGILPPRGRQHELLRCISRYPAPHGMVPEAFSLGGRYQGWSDHCIGTDSCEVAILRGARIIEKHVQLPEQARAPKPFEATVEEFKRLRAFADDDPTRFVGRWRAA